MSQHVRARITDETFLVRALEALLRSEELKESDLYEITGSKSRVPGFLD